MAEVAVVVWSNGNFSFLQGPHCHLGFARTLLQPSFATGASGSCLPPQTVAPAGRFVVGSVQVVPRNWTMDSNDSILNLRNLNLRSLNVKGKVIVD